MSAVEVSVTAELSPMPSYGCFGCCGLTGPSAALGQLDGPVFSGPLSTATSGNQGLDGVLGGMRWANTAITFSRPEILSNSSEVSER
jgi:hypothetical protein